MHSVIRAFMPYFDHATEGWKTGLWGYNCLKVTDNYNTPYSGAALESKLLSTCVHYLFMLVTCIERDQKVHAPKAKVYESAVYLKLVITFFRAWEIISSASFCNQIFTQTSIKKNEQKFCGLRRTINASSCCFKTAISTFFAGQL